MSSPGRVRGGEGSGDRTWRYEAMAANTDGWGAAVDGEKRVVFADELRGANAGAVGIAGRSEMGL